MVPESQNLRFPYYISWLDMLNRSHGTGTDDTPAVAFAVEIEAPEAALIDLVRRARDHFKSSSVGHMVAVEQPARIIVTFTDSHPAERFFWRFGGRFVRVPDGTATPSR